MRYILTIILLAISINAHAWGLWGNADMGLGGAQRNNLAVYLPLKSDLTGNVTATYTRSGTQAVTDFSGISVNVTAANVPGFTGARAVTNYLLRSGDFTNVAAWANSMSGGDAANPIITANYAAAPDGTNTATRAQFNRGTAGGGYSQKVQTVTTGLAAGSSVVHSVWLKSNDSNTYDITMGDVINGPLTAIAVTPTWTQYSFISKANATSYFEIGLRQLYADSQTADILIWHPMMEDGTGKLFNTPGEYQATVASSASSFYPYTGGVHNFATFGDSLTETYGPYSAWPELIRASIGSNSTLLNKGVSSSTSTQIAATQATVPITNNQITIIYAGYNDISYAAGGLCTTVTTNLATMVGRLKTNRYLILSIPTGSQELSGSAAHTRIVNCNSTIAGAYPDNYLDLRTYLVSQYNPDLPQDVTDHGNDIIPSSLRRDYIHPNQLGYTVMANYILSALQSKSWFNGYFVPTGTAIETTKGILLDTTTALSITAPSVIKSGSFYWTPKTLSGTQWLMGSYTSAAVQTGIFYDGTNVTFRKRLASTNYDATKALTAVAGTTYLIRWVVNADNTTAIYVDGVQGTNHANTTAPTWAATIKIGNDGNSANQQVGSIKEFKIFK